MLIVFFLISTEAGAFGGGAVGSNSAEKDADITNKDIKNRKAIFRDFMSYLPRAINFSLPASIPVLLSSLVRSIMITRLKEIDTFFSNKIDYPMFLNQSP